MDTCTALAGRAVQYLKYGAVNTLIKQATAKRAVKGYRRPRPSAVRSARLSYTAALAAQSGATFLLFTTFLGPLLFAMAAEALPRPSVGVGVFVRSPSHPGCFLLGRRRNARGDGTFALPGGHLEQGESWAECARREVLEETGCSVHNVRHGTVINSKNPATGFHYVVIFMVADVLPGTEPFNPEPHKCDGWAWQDSLAGIAGPVFQPLQEVLSLGFDPSGTDPMSAKILHAPDDALPPYCCAILHEGDAVFLEQRSAAAAVAAGQLTCFGGKRNPDETALACITRELEEELGASWWVPPPTSSPTARKRSRDDDEDFGLGSTARRPRLHRAVDLYVDGQLIAWFFRARAPARDAALTFEEGRHGVWLAGAELSRRLASESTASASGASASLSPWHASVLRAWRKGEPRADFVTSVAGDT